MVLTCNCIAGHCFVGLRFFSIHKLNEVTGISDGFFLVPGFELKRATGRASSRQLAPGCGRIARRSSLEHPHPMPLYPQIVLQTRNCDVSEVRAGIKCVASDASYWQTDDRAGN